METQEVLRNQLSAADALTDLIKEAISMSSGSKVLATSAISTSSLVGLAQALHIATRTTIEICEEMRDQSLETLEDDVDEGNEPTVLTSDPL